jgi:hypothetical protein
MIGVTAFIRGIQISVFSTAASGTGFITIRNEVSQTSWETRRLGRWNAWRRKG